MEEVAALGNKLLHLSPSPVETHLDCRQQAGHGPIELVHVNRSPCLFQGCGCCPMSSHSNAHNVQRGCSRLQMFRAGELVHGYLAKPEPRAIDHFEEVIRDSYRDSATFMNAVVVERFFPGRSVRIHNLKLTESTPDRVASVELSGLEQLVQAVERHFGIPAAVVRGAVDGPALEGDIYT